MMDRRAFLRRLGFGTVAAAAAANGLIDVEKLLWVPGEKTIFIPPPPKVMVFQLGDILTIEGRYTMNPLTRQLTEHLQRFVVTATTTDDTTVTVHPLVEDGYRRGNMVDRRRERVQPWMVGHTWSHRRT